MFSSFSIFPKGLLSLVQVITSYLVDVPPDLKDFFIIQIALVSLYRVTFGRSIIWPFNLSTCEVIRPNLVQIIVSSRFFFYHFFFYLSLFDLIMTCCSKGTTHTRWRIYGTLLYSPHHVPGATAAPMSHLFFFFFFFFIKKPFNLTLKN